MRAVVADAVLWMVGRANRGMLMCHIFVRAQVRDRRVLTTLVQAFDKCFYFGLVLICLTSMKRSEVISWTGQAQRREKVVAERRGNEQTL